MKHPHAEFLHAIADGERLEDWECTISDDDPLWRDAFGYTSSLPLQPHSWVVRRKPRTIRIGEYDVPMPESRELKYHQQYYVASTSEGARKQNWDDDEIDWEWLSLGLIHLTREAAELHRKALLSFTAQEPKK